MRPALPRKTGWEGIAEENTGELGRADHLELEISPKGRNETWASPLLVCSQQQTDTQTHTERERETDRHRHTHTRTHTQRHRHTDTHTETDRQTQTHTHTNTHTQRHRHTHTDTERDRQTDTDTHSVRTSYVSVKQVQTLEGLQGRKRPYLPGPVGVVSTGYMMMLWSPKSALESCILTLSSPTTFPILNRLRVCPSCFLGNIETRVLGVLMQVPSE